MSNTPPIDPSSWGNSQPPTPQLPPPPSVQPTVPLTPPPGWNGDPNPASQTSQPGWGQSPAPATGWGQTAPPGFSQAPGTMAPGQTPPPGFYPPQGYAAGLQPGWAQAGMPVAPPKKRKTWLIVLFVVLGLFIALIFAAVLWVAISTSREEGPSKEVAEKFMVAVQDEDYRAASKLVCSDSLLSTSATGLERDLAITFGGERVSGYTFSEFEWRSSGSSNTVTGIISNDGELRAVAIDVKQVDGEWCVDYVIKRSSVLP